MVIKIQVVVLRIVTPCSDIEDGDSNMAVHNIGIIPHHYTVS